MAGLVISDRLYGQLKEMWAWFKAARATQAQAAPQRIVTQPNAWPFRNSTGKTIPAYAPFAVRRGSSDYAGKYSEAWQPDDFGLDLVVINGPDEVAADAWGTATLPIYEQATAAIGAGIVAGDNVGLKPGTFTFAKGYPGFHVLTSPTSGRADVVYRAPPNLFWIEIAGEISYSGAEIPHVEARRLSWQTDNDDYEQINEAITLYFPGALRDNNGDFVGLPVGRENERFPAFWNHENRHFEALSCGDMLMDVELSGPWTYSGDQIPYASNARVVVGYARNGTAQYSTHRVTIYNPFAAKRVDTGDYLGIPHGQAAERYTCRWDVASGRITVIGPQRWRCEIELGQAWSYYGDIPHSDSVKVLYWDRSSGDWLETGVTAKARFPAAVREGGQYVGIPIGRNGLRFSAEFDPDGGDLVVTGQPYGLVYPAKLSYSPLARNGTAQIQVSGLDATTPSVADKGIVPDGDPILTNSNLIVAWSESLGKFVWLAAECSPGDQGS